MAASVSEAVSPLTMLTLLSSHTLQWRFSDLVFDLVTVPKTLISALGCDSLVFSAVCFKITFGVMIILQMCQDPKLRLYLT